MRNIQFFCQQCKKCVDSHRQGATLGLVNPTYTVYCHEKEEWVVVRFSLEEGIIRSVESTMSVRLDKRQYKTRVVPVFK